MNNSHAAEVMRRRENVARLRLRGFTQREIMALLAKLPDGPITASLGTVNGDLKVLMAGWRVRAAELIDERKARQLAEIDEARRRAWADGDLMALARFIDLETKIFGTAAPTRVEVYDARKEAAQYGVDLDSLADNLFAQAKLKSDAGNYPA